MSKTLIISGVSIDRTPIVKFTIEELKRREISCEILEMKKKRFQFIYNALILIFSSKPKNVIFIGIQTLPILLISQISRTNKFYWYLESYTGNENNSLIMKTILLEKFIYWKNIYAIFPIKERVLPYINRTFKKTIILPNTTETGRQFQEKNLANKNKVKIVFYGSLDNNSVYVKEFIDFVKKYDNLYLDFIGSNFTEELNSQYNIRYLGSLSHKELMKKMNEYQYSIVGYRPTNFNTKFCAPNKLYEAMSNSLPTILNIANPTLANHEEIERIGILVDFSNLNHHSFELITDNENYKQQNIGSYNLYETKYNLSNYFDSFYQYIKL